MRYYDEVLAQAARNYAFTGDKKWEQRYKVFEPKSDKLLKKVVEHADKNDKVFFSTMDKTNLALVAMETRALELVNSGHASKAINLLESEDYEKQRKILRDGLAEYVQTMEIEQPFQSIDVMVDSVKDLVELERKLALSETSIKNEKEKYRSLYENSTVLLRTVDPNGIVLDCNKSYAEHLGYSKEELIGSSIFKTTVEQSFDAMRNSLDAWKKTGHVTNQEIWFKRKDETIFPVLLSANNLFSEDGTLIGSNTEIKDMTEIYQARKKIEENEAHLRMQYEKLKKVDAIKDEFLTMVTHELKTPLVPIKGYVDMLLSETLGSLNDAQKNRLGIIQKSTVALLKLITNILDAQKIELGQLHINKKMHDLSEIIGNTINQMKPDITYSRITITTDLQPNILCLCDDMRIEQVITNLVSNALDFCPKDTGEIQIKLQRVDDDAKIIVKDNGVGIIKDNIDKIFVKFYQVDEKTTREHGGTGLGLSVCKGIVESHGGKIWAESKGRGEGAEIHVLLPL